jgi:DNA adenine methylase
MTTPFLKWAGGKTQVLKQMQFPEKFGDYYEPFLGGGAVFFHLAPKLTCAYLSDINKDLVNTYKVVRDNVEELILILEFMQDQHINQSDFDRKEYYYMVRAAYNNNSDSIMKAAQFIYLNRTCFNGLYRVNASGQFNVPMGKYAKPRICDASNLREASKALQIAIIEEGHYCLRKPSVNSFVYYDPPYRPLSKTSAFVGYDKSGFDDNDQRNLAMHIKLTAPENNYFMLSNSDPHNTDPGDNFFDDLYNWCNIKRIQARRNVNSKSENRGLVSELLITNY